MNIDPKQLDRVVEAVAESAKYRGVSPELVREISRRELGKGRGLKDTVKAVKNKLHQVAGAYLDEGSEQSSEASKSRMYARWLEEVRQARSTGSADELKSACRKIMAHHASTRERLPILDDFYSRIFALLPPIRTIIDVACGLNPLTIPWMPLAPDTEYHAYDIYSDMMAFLGDFMGEVGAKGKAEMRDMVSDPPQETADLALVLKAIPCLEQIDKTAGQKLLDGLNARHMVVSFPTASLGGRNKGMAANYEARLRELAEGKEWQTEKLEFSTELVFVVTKAG